MAGIRRLWLAWVLAIAVTAGFGQPALAHGAGAVVSFAPPVPKPGQMGTVQVKMLDAYGAVIPAKVRAAVGAMDEPPPAASLLVEQPAGIHTVQVRFPEAVGALLRLEVELPDGPAKGQLMFRVGEGGFPVQDLPVDLMHEGESTDNGKPYGVPSVGESQPAGAADGGAGPPGRSFPWGLAAVLGAVLAAGWAVVARRR